MARTLIVTLVLLGVVVVGCGGNKCGEYLERGELATKCGEEVTLADVGGDAPQDVR